MPELPDIHVFANHLNDQLSHKVVREIKVVQGKKLKDQPTDLSRSLEGQSIQEVFRSGKELRILFSNSVVLGIHLMLTGDLFLFKKINEQKFTIVEIYFTDGSGIALTDRMKNAFIKINPEDKEGIDVLDASFTFKTLKKILDRKAKIKNVLLDQKLIRGIGNSYSDEILWEARISPHSVARAIPDEKIKDLVRISKKVMKNAINKISKAYPGLIQGEVKDFLNIHTNKKTHSPTGAKILVEKRGMLKMYYTREQILYSE